MMSILDPMAETGLRFFGSTSASISHELKNALAIIKENAGLLNDYVNLMDRGTSIDPARFQTIAKRIEDQARRADNHIRTLNRFAHMVDEATKTADLNELVALLVELFQRPAAMQQVTLKLQLAQTPPLVETAPYLLLTALGRCLAFALQAVPPGQILQVGLLARSHEILICFDLLTGLSNLAPDSFPTVAEHALFAALKVTYTAEAAAQRISLAIAQR
jgi:C4-dicarboxylate-specific signal transduction histidine kinase